MALNSCASSSHVGCLKHRKYFHPWVWERFTARCCWIHAVS